MMKPKILFLLPGPTYRPLSPFFQMKYELFSEFYGGYILTSSSKAQTIKIGDFFYQSMARSKRFGNLKYIIFCICSALKIRKRNSVDLIITYDPLKTGIIGCVLKKILNAKLIVEVNGVYTSPVVWVDEQTSHLKKKIKKLILPSIMRFVFSHSEGIKLLFARQIDDVGAIRNRNKKAVFHDWVPLSYFKNLGEKKEILLVGFPFYIKGVDILVKSFKRIAPRFPDWSLKILGWYPDKTLLENAIAGHPQIICQPPVPHSEMPEHIGKTGILVLPSRTEAMGRVLLEAAAAGKPRIGANVDGIPTVINDGVDGFLVPSENVESLSEKISFLIQSPKLRKTIGTAAAERASIEFSEHKYIENYSRFIQDIKRSS